MNQTAELSEATPPVLSCSEVLPLLFRGNSWRRTTEDYTPHTRQWLFELVKEWHENSGSTVFAVVGVPGVGKSVFMRQLCIRAESTPVEGAQVDGAAQVQGTQGEDAPADDRGRNVVRVIAQHFFRHDDAHGMSCVLQCLQAVANQIARTVPEFHDNLLRVAKAAREETKVLSLFQRILVEPLQGVAHDRCCVVLDALDECQDSQTADLLKLITRKWVDLMPSWLRLVVSMRPILASKFKHQVVLGENTEENRADIRCCIRQRLKDRMNSQELAQAVESLVERSEGLFLYIRLILAELECKKEITLADVQLLPAGLNDAFEENFERLHEELGADCYHKLLGE